MYTWKLVPYLCHAITGHDMDTQNIHEHFKNEVVSILLHTNRVMLYSCLCNVATG